MSYFYIDESIHDKAGFIIASCVYSKKDLNDYVRRIIKFKGFDPNNYEYKSNTNYSKEPEKIEVREELKNLIADYCYLGLVIVPREYRALLGIECLKALKQFIEKNEKVTTPIQIFFDQGIFPSNKLAKKKMAQLDFKDCKFYFQMDSRMYGGIQIADLCAHSCSILLKDTLGLINKKIKVGENSGYDPNMEVELAFELWADLRYTFFNQVSKIITDDPIEDATLDVEPYGLFVSELCDEKLAKSARNTFSQVYLGCIH